MKRVIFTTMMKNWGLMDNNDRSTLYINKVEDEMTVAKVDWNGEFVAYGNHQNLIISDMEGNLIRKLNKHKGDVSQIKSISWHGNSLYTAGLQGVMKYNVREPEFDKKVFESKTMKLKSVDGILYASTDFKSYKILDDSFKEIDHFPDGRNEILGYLGPYTVLASMDEGLLFIDKDNNIENPTKTDQ